MSYDPPLNIEKTADGAVNVSNERVITQISPAYGIINSEVFTSVSGTGAEVGVIDDKFYVTSGTDADGTAVLLTNTFCKYRAAQGLVCRLSATFSLGALNQQQLAGLIDSSSGVGFAMVSGVFGVLHYYSGEPELQQLEITTAASGAEVATVTINGTGYPVNLTAASAEINAVEIADQLNGVISNYIVTANQNTVTAQAIFPNPAGAFDFTSATAGGTWAQIQQGEPIVTDFTPQADWNGDDTSWLDPTQLNAYEIEFIDAGNINLNVVDPDTGEHIRAHMIQRVNNTTEPAASQPAFRAGWAVQNFGAITEATIQGVSCGVFQQGQIKRQGSFSGLDNDQIDVGTDQTSVLILRNRSSFGGNISRAILLPRLITAATQATKPAFLDIRVNPVFDSDVIYQYLDEDNSIVEYSLQSVGVSGGRLLTSLTVGTMPAVLQLQNSSETDVQLSPSDVICVSARMSAAPASDVQAAITLLEDL